VAWNLKLNKFDVMRNSDVATLRKKAEKLSKTKLFKTDMQFPEVEARKLIQELEVHRIELELQNEELLLAKEQAEVAFEKYAELYNFAPSGYFTLSKEGEIIELNLSGANMLGKERSRLKNSQFRFFVSDETKPCFNLFLGKVFCSKAIESCEVILSTNGNSPIYVHLTGIADQNEEQCLITMIDITERKRTEEELKLSNSRNLAILNAIPDLMFRINCNGVFLDFQAQTTSDLYVHPDMIIGRKLHEILPTYIVDLISRYLQTILKTGELQVFEYALPMPAGTCFFEARMALSGSDEIVTIVRNITEPKLAKEKLLESEERYKRITEVLTDYLYTVNIKDGKVLETIHNEACFAITGYTRKEFSEDPYLWINMVVPEDREFVAKRVSNIFDEKEQSSIEHRIRCKNGQIRWIIDTIIPKYNADGQLISYDGVIQNITERKRAEQELIKAKEKAEESDRLKSSFLTNISHEIRTPMNGILGFSELLKEQKLTGEEQQEYLNIIARSGSRMLNTINDIITISKIESGEMNVSASETNVNEQIEYIYTLFKPEAEKKGIAIFFKNTLPINEAIIKTDSNKVAAILSNLLKNAIKFTSQGSIEFGCVKKNDQYLEFFVKDSGMGIRPECNEFIFERFRQGSEALNRKYEGAGLGLSISKAYIEMLGGKIWVESEEGKGATFYFTIPCQSHD
jgi:PAS domain S-box-containing protein